MFSHSTEYAIKALKYLAQQPTGSLSGAGEIAAGTQIPLPYLWKLLKSLSEVRLVRSFKGVKGGYELARSPKDITIRDIWTAIPRGAYFVGCALNSSECDEWQPCRLLRTWENLCAELDKTTVADLMRPPARRIVPKSQLHNQR